MEIETLCSSILCSEQDSLKPTLSPSVQKSVESIIKKKGYVTYKVNSRQISPDGGNFLGYLFELDITGQTDCEKKETNLFIKHVIPGEAMKDVFSISEFYERECFAYVELSRMFKEVQEDANVPVAERFKLAKGYKESNAEGIIMENLAKRGFGTYDRMTVPTLKFMELSIKELAKFHALSFVMEKKRPEFYTKIRKLESLMKCNEDWVKMARNQIRLTTKNLKPELKKIAEDYTSTILTKFPQYLQDCANTTCCLTHGDYRMNNILKKEVDGVVTEVIPVDYQIIQWSSPVHDLLYFIFTSTDKKFRDLHLSDLKNVYYHSFKTFLRYFDISSEDVFSKTKFEAEFNERLDFGLQISLMYSCILFAPGDDLPDLGSGSFDDFNYDLDVSIVKRIEDILEDFIEWGYL